MMPEIETCLKKIEENPAFRLGNSRTRSVEIALRVLKNQKECTINKTTYQHEWSWLICALSAFTGLPIYSVWHHYWTGYSKEKTLDLIKTTLTELLAQEDVIDSDLLSCVIKVNVAHFSFSSWGYWMFFKDAPEEIHYHFKPLIATG